MNASSKRLTLIGAGAGTPTAFDKTTETFIDAGATTKPGLTTGNHSTTIEGLRIRGSGKSKTRSVQLTIVKSPWRTRCFRFA